MSGIPRAVVADAGARRVARRNERCRCSPPHRVPAGRFSLVSLLDSGLKSRVYARSRTARTPPQTPPGERKMNPSPPALVCDLSTLTDDQRLQLRAVSADVFGAASEVQELPNGFALAFRDASANLISKIAEFIAYDRLCCAFLEHG